jgi:uncharacterized small protein (DUF1192 family)
VENSLRSLVVRLHALSPAWRRLVYASCLLVGVFFLIFVASNRMVPPGTKQVSTPPDGGSLTGEILPPDDVRTMVIGGKEVGAPTLPHMLPESYRAGQVDSANAFREPRIAYSAELSVVTKEFAHSRSSLEEILERRHGYVAKLRMVGQPSGSVLSATLRVPSSEYRSALTELKAVGLVEHEEEAADEITQQHSELEARLVNAQNEEKRIQRILQNREDRFTDQAALERQVAMLRGEIERIQAERYSSGSRVSFANVFFSLREERTPPAVTIGARLRDAAVSGLSDSFESISTILLFLAGRGPLFALWAVLLYFPARFLWRRRSQLAFSEAQAPKNL